MASFRTDMEAHYIYACTYHLFELYKIHEMIYVKGKLEHHMSVVREKPVIFTKLYSDQQKTIRPSSYLCQKNLCSGKRRDGICVIVSVTDTDIFHQHQLQFITAVIV